MADAQKTAQAEDRLRHALCPAATAAQRCLAASEVAR